MSDNSRQVEQAIYAALQRALLQLKQITEAKMGVLLGDELELKRQLGEIDHMEEFLKVYLGVA